MKAFVTGSTGLLGSNLVALLKAQGHTVKALARSPEKAARFLASDVEIVRGDMEDVAGFAAELTGCDVLFHTAAYFREYFGRGDHWSKLERINVHATIELFKAAEKAGVKKVIYVSSSGVIGMKPGGLPGDETTPPDGPALQNLYFRSKVAAEQAIYEFMKTHSLPIVQILPTAIYGPGDSGPTGAGQLILDFLGKKLPGIPPGGFSVVDVRDVAQAMLNAVERGKSGERYIINNRYYRMSEIFAILGKVSGVSAPTMAIPAAIALIFAYVSETVANLRGVESSVTVNGARTLLLRREVKTDKAQRELGVVMRPFEDTLRDEVNWFQTHGYVGSNQNVNTFPIGKSYEPNR